MRDIFPPHHQPRQPFDEGIKMISRCPVCHYNYNPLEAKVLEHNDTTHLLFIKCRRCSSSILALVMTSGLGISSYGLVTDLDSGEVTRFKDSEPLNADDVLAVYRMLCGQNGAQRALYL